MLKCTKCPKCAQGRNFAQGEALPKRDIVDTTFHASCATRQNRHKQAAFPTTWGRNKAGAGTLGLMGANTMEAVYI